LDFPATSFILAMIASSLYGRYALFALFAVFALFTRETGLSFYLAYTIPFLFVFFVRARKFDLKHFRSLFLISLPALAYVFYVLYRQIGPGVFVWGGDTTSNMSLAKLFLKYDLTNPYVVTHLLQVFVLNFNWIFTLAILLYFGGKIVSRIHSWIQNKPYQPPHKPISIRWDAFAVLLIAFVPNAIVLFNYITFPIPRYRIPLIPFFLFFGLYCLIALLQKKRIVGQVLLASIAFLTLAQNFYSIDSVSNDIFGLFDFGHRPMICMKRITTREPDCGRDQIIYNLQYTHVLALADKAVHMMIPDEQGNLHIASTANTNHPFIFANIDLNEHRITLEKVGKGVIKPTLYTVDRRHLSHDYTPVRLFSELSDADRPQRLYYLAYPMYGEDYYDLQKLERRGYRLTNRVPLDDQGTTAELLTLEL
jgi:hypothetical protein